MTYKRDYFSVDNVHTNQMLMYLFCKLIIFIYINLLS